MRAKDLLLDVTEGRSGRKTEKDERAVPLAFRQRQDVFHMREEGGVVYVHLVKRREEGEKGSVRTFGDYIQKVTRRNSGLRSHLFLSRMFLLLSAFRCFIFFFSATPLSGRLSYLSSCPLFSALLVA